MKYKAKKGYDQIALKETYWVERTHPIYGFPAVELPSQPKFTTYAQAQEYAKHLNGENKQLKLF